MEIKGINELFNNLVDYINDFGLDFLTEDQLRFCFIKGLKLKAKQNVAEVEKPYIFKVYKKKYNNGGILDKSDLLLNNSRARLDLFYKSDNTENYLEFKLHLTKEFLDDPHTKFGEVMNDLHRLSHLVSSKEHKSNCSNKKYYFVYAFNENMKDWLKDLKNLNIVDLFVGEKAEFNAAEYMSNTFWDSGQTNPSYGYGEFRKKSFASFNCKNNDHKNAKEDYWLPKNGTDFLNNIKYERIFSKEINGLLNLVILEIRY